MVPHCCCCCCYCFMLLLSWNCHCACATTDESQQQQQQQCYTVTTIIKQLMITKILNNLCRFICMLLLLCKWSFVEKTCVMQWADMFKWSAHWAMMSKPPSSNQPQIYATPLHWMSFAYSRMHIYLGQMSPCQLTIDLWNTTTPKNFHMEQNAHITWSYVPLSLLQLTIDLCNTTTPHMFNI